MPTQSETTPSVDSINSPTVTLHSHRLILLTNRRRTINFLHGMPILEKCFRCTYNCAMFIAYYAMLQTFFSFLTCVFNLYNSRSVFFLWHNNYSIWFMDVYIIDVITLLVSCIVVLMILSLIVMGTSIMLIPSLQENQSKGIVIWLYSFGAFLTCRYVVLLVNEFTNNVYNVYDLVIPLTGSMMAVLNIYAWLLMFSYNYKISQIILFKKLIPALGISGLIQLAVHQQGNTTNNSTDQSTAYL